MSSASGSTQALDPPSSGRRALPVSQRADPAAPTRFVTFALSWDEPLGTASLTGAHSYVH